MKMIPDCTICIVTDGKNMCQLLCFILLYCT